VRNPVPSISRRVLAIPLAFAALLTILLLVREERGSGPPVVRRTPRFAPLPTVAGPDPEIVRAMEPDRALRGDTESNTAPEQSRKTVPPTAPPGDLLQSPWRPGYMGMNGVDAPGGGALVTQVFPSTAAHHAGLLVGDVVTEFNGRSVPDLASLFQWARNTGEGTPISLRIRRAGVEIFIGLQLGRHPLYN
jgi:hypothetical protein